VRLFNEFKTFIWNNGKPQAMRTYHDDLVMSLAIGCWVRDTALAAGTRNVNHKKACLDSIIFTSRRINTQIPGQIGYEKDILQKAHQSVNEQKQFIWLLKG
jgi:hypothetical protein